MCSHHHILTVPVLYRGRFASVRSLDRWIAKAMTEPSVLGGVREGVVVRWRGAFDESEFTLACCKSVRANHVQTDEHWTRRWKRCSLATDTQATIETGRKRVQESA